MGIIHTAKKDVSSLLFKKYSESPGKKLNTKEVFVYFKYFFLLLCLKLELFAPTICTYSTSMLKKM